MLGVSIVREIAAPAAELEPYEFRIVSADRKYSGIVI